VKDKERFTEYLDPTIGSAKIPLEQVVIQGKVEQWIPVSKKDTVVGDIHVIMEYVPKGIVGNPPTNAV